MFIVGFLTCAFIVGFLFFLGKIKWIKKVPKSLTDSKGGGFVDEPNTEDDTSNKINN